MTTEMKAQHTRKAGPIVSIIAAMMLLLVACGSADTEASETASFDQASSDESMDAMDGDSATGAEIFTGDAMEEEAMEEEAMADEESFEGADDSAVNTQSVEGESDLGAGGSTAVNQTAANIGRKIIFTANLTVEVTDVAAAGAQATEIIEAEGGFLFGQETIGGSEAQSILTFKVDPDRFDTALEKLGGVGELRNQTVSADDVTGPIVDLQSKIEVAELGVERLKAALVNAPTLEDYAEIERLLITRESELAVMRGQLRTLQSKVDLATITVALVQDRVVNNLELTVTAYEGFDGGANCPGEQSLRPEADSEVTICFELFNTGDQTLTDIAITDTVLEIDEETNLIEVYDTLDALEPGQSAVVAFETAPERFTTLRTRVTAIPTDGTSGEQVAPTVTTTGSYDLRVFGEEDNPGFGDGFSAALSVLSELWVVTKVLIGFALPMLIFLPFLWLAWRGLKALRRRRPPKPQKVGSSPTAVPAYASGWTPAGQQPPPPVATAAGSYSPIETKTAQGSDQSEDADESGTDLSPETDPS